MSLPIRVRLTAWYAALLAIILVALGAFLVLRLQADLEQRVERDVRIAAEGIAAGYAEDGTSELAEVARTALPRRGAAVQVLDRSGEVLVAFGAADPRRPIVPSAARSAALLGDDGAVRLELGSPPREYHAWVTSVRRLGRRHVLVVGEWLRDAETPVRRVLVLLLLAGPAALAATALVGWWIARKALLPVDRMASAAEAIEIDRLDERIAVPRASDELAHLAVTLNAMLDRLEQGVAEKRRLVADASHELRTPLAVMRAELDVTLRDDLIGDQAREVLESAREEVDRMTRTVDNLLTLAQVDEGRLGLLPSRVDLVAAAEAAARPLRPLADHKRVTIAVDGRPTRVDADPQHIHLALTNLIENAIKFTPSGGDVHVTAWSGQDEAGVTVADDGPGIPADSLDHVFDRFYRVDRSRGRGAGGSGLGLAICREIARAHGGRIAIDSEEGRGSAFSLALPRNGHA
jgi:heavy metal sensor kinase